MATRQSKNYNWTRYWQPYSKPDTADSANARSYYSDMGSYLFGSSGVSLFEIDELLQIPCLILLGEPGMGKSSALEELRTRLHDDAENRYQFFDLAVYDSGQDFRNTIFVDNPIFHEWRPADFYLHVFLDSLDEAQLQISRVAANLIRSLENYSSELDRLRLRIVCRASDWPAELESHLQKLWGQELVKTFILAPLQEHDVVSAAQEREVDVDEFLAEIRRKDVSSFAVRPVTFNFLLDEYCKSGQLPETRRDIYMKGCKHLCHEIKATHARQDKLEPEQRFLIASRIAASSVFTGYPLIQADSNVTENNQALSLPDISGDPEHFGDLQIDYVYETYVRETLETALFKGGTIRQWAHRTYAEFLAAWYVVHTMSFSQIKSVIFHPGERVIPQLRETAAWIASFQQEIFEEILQTDPDVLLRSDVASTDAETREKLLAELLKRTAIDPDRHYDLSRLPSFKYSGLAQFLEPYITDSTLDIHVRRFAIECAIDCKEDALQDSLLQVALDDGEETYLRVAAARGLLDLGDAATKKQLKPLVFLSLNHRANGDLKRHGIIATWPTDLSASEFFDCLEVPSEEDHLLDSYVIENWSQVILPKLTVQDLPYALQWVQRQERSYKLHQSFQQLMDTILLEAWQHLTYPFVAKAFAETVVSLWLNHDSLIDRHAHRRPSRADMDGALTSEVVCSDLARRSLLLRHLIPIAATYHARLIGYKFVWDAPLLTFEDTSHLVEIFVASQSSSEKELLVELLYRVVQLEKPQQFEFVYTQGQRHPDLWQALNYPLSIQLNSEEAEQARQRYQEEQQQNLEMLAHELSKQNPPISPSPYERVLKYLADFDRGNVDAWWQMSYWMEINPDGTSDTYKQIVPTFQGLPVWEYLTNQEQEKIVSTAVDFLHAYNPDKLQWWKRRGSIYHPIVAGWRALLLMIAQGQQIDQRLADTMRRWAPALTFHAYQWVPVSLAEHQERKQKQYLLDVMFKLFPDEVSEVFLWLAECEDHDNDFYLPSGIEHLWDERLSKMFLHAIQQNTFSLKAADLLLQRIAANHLKLVAKLLQDWITSTQEEDWLERACIAGSLLMLHGENAGWEIVWPAIQQNTELGIKIIERIAGADRYKSEVAGRLHEEQIGELSWWLFQQFPPGNDPNRSGYYTITLAHEIADFRDSALRNLAEKGTEQAIQQLRKLQSDLGINLNKYIRWAEELWLQRSWQPLTPQQFRDLTRNKRSRWIQSGSQLLDVIIELLGKLNLELQGIEGSNPAVIDLWNEYRLPVDGKRVTKRTPKDEERLSDYVERFLKRELKEKNVFIARETQVRRGSLTDIYIETKPISSGNNIGSSITVIVEVKGCWHSELKKAMKEQLKERYLAETGLWHGVYLIGRFMCGEWDNEHDQRWHNSPKNVSIEYLQETYNQQASQLSSDGFDIRAFVMDARWQA